MTPAELLIAARAAGLTLSWTAEGKLSAPGPRAAAELGRQVLDRHADYAVCARCRAVAVADVEPALCAECTDVGSNVIPLRQRHDRDAPVSGDAPAPAAVKPPLWHCDFCGWFHHDGDVLRCEACGWPREVPR